MSTPDLRQRLARASSIKWERLLVQPEDGMPIDWIPIIEANIQPGPTIGITRNGEWIAVTARGVTFIEHGKKSAWLLALDYSLKEIQSKIRQAISESELAEHVSQALPYMTIINEGLDYGNSPGVLSAIRWLEADHGLLNDEIHQRLAEIIDDRSYTQNVRHRAMKLVVSYRRTLRGG